MSLTLIVEIIEEQTVYCLPNLFSRMQKHVKFNAKTRKVHIISVICC